MIRYSFVLLAVVLLTCGIAFAGTFFDDFDDNELNEEYWFVNKTSGCTSERVDEIDGQIEMSGLTGGWEGIGLGLDIELDLTLGETIIEADMFLQNTDGHFYFISLRSEGDLWGNGLWAFNAILDGGETVCSFEEDKGASVDPVPRIPVDQTEYHHYRIALSPTGEDKKFDFHISVDDGALGEASGVLDLNTSSMPIDPTFIYLYLIVEQDDGMNESTYFDNFEITSPVIIGTIGRAVDPADKLAITWAAVKAP